jgi:predicted nucleic acid-binding protein
MAIILDVDVIIRGEKGTFDLRGWLASRAAEEFEIAAVTVAELWHGVERATGARRAARLHYLETILALLPVITKQSLAKNFPKISLIANKYLL